MKTLKSFQELDAVLLVNDDGTAAPVTDSLVEQMECFFTNEVNNPSLHFVGCLIGKGNGHDFPRLGITSGENVRNATGENASLTRTCARYHEQWTAALNDGVALWLSETLE